MPIECSICREELIQPGSTLSTTPCGHVYHRQCLLLWIENNQNTGSCPICRANFDPYNVIPLLTLEESTSSASNNQQPMNVDKLTEMQSLLNSVMDSLLVANEELKAKDAIIESLKKRIERQEIPDDYHGGGNCPHKVCVRPNNNNDDSGLSDLVNSLEDDELEFNLRIS
ncbi:hypothetical protein ACKWTF_012859 [Chironomus riparius]